MDHRESPDIEAVRAEVALQDAVCDIIKRIRALPLIYGVGTPAAQQASSDIGQLVEDLVRKFATHGNPLETLSTTLSQHGSLTFVQSRRGVAIYHVQWHLLVEASTLDQAIDKLAKTQPPTRSQIGRAHV